MDVPITQPGTEVPFSLNKGQIDVCNVEFAYPTCDEIQVPVLKGVSINVSKEQRVIALVGSSGSGKSSIISLIEQFYIPTGGQILFNGRDINTLDPKWYHQQIGIV